MLFLLYYNFRISEPRPIPQPDNLPSNICADSWFGSAKTALQCSICGINFIGAVKNSSSGFPKRFLEEHLLNEPGGSRLVLEGIHSITGKKLIAIGYKYSSSGKVLFYVATPEAGSTMPGLPYEMRFTDE